MLTSIIIRTFNEQKYLKELIQSIRKQRGNEFESEIIIVDSGSTDRTLEIAEDEKCHIVHIKKSEFSFGRSLNIGCNEASGNYLAFISGHCIPQNDVWLDQLINPLIHDQCAYIYGRQIGGDTSKFSECQLFSKFYPANNRIPQEGFFCNNANAALKKSVWMLENFDEKLTGLEDMDLAKRLVNRGYVIGYSAQASVYHIHEESWRKVRLRYEREAIALQKIMPEVQVSLPETLRYFISSLFYDAGAALQDKVFLSKLSEIFMFRFMQYWGTYKGNHEHRKISQKLKESYFYPK